MILSWRWTGFSIGYPLVTSAHQGCWYNPILSPSFSLVWNYPRRLNCLKPPSIRCYVFSTSVEFTVQPEDFLHISGVYEPEYLVSIQHYLFLEVCGRFYWLISPKVISWNGVSISLVRQGLFFCFLFSIFFFSSLHPYGPLVTELSLGWYLNYGFVSRRKTA